MKRKLLLKAKNNFLPLLFFLILLVFHLKTLTLYPVASVDESWLSSEAKAMVDQNFIKINSPFFLSNAGISDFPKLLFGIYYKLFGFGLLQGRLFILFQSLILLFLVYKFTYKFFGKDLSILSAVFLSSTYNFLFSSHLIRFDVPFASFLIISLWLFFLYLKTDKLHYCYWSGMVLGFSYEVWMNGLLFQISFILSWVLLQILSKRITVKPLIFFISGVLVYWIFFVVVHILPDVKNFQFTTNYMFNIDHPLPLLSLPLKDIILEEISRYKHNFSQGGIFELAAISTATLWSIRSKDVLIKFISLYFLTSAFLFMLLASNKAFFYFIYLLPLSAVLISQFVKNSAILPKKFLLLILLVIVGFNFLRQYNLTKKYSDYDYQQVKNVFSPYLQKNSLILGEAHYYLPLYEYGFSNIVLLTWFRIYEGLNSYQALSKINPDFIIIDPFIEGRLVDNESEIKNTDFQRGLHNVLKYDFMRFMNERTTLVTSFNSKYYGNIKLYKVNK